MIVYFTGTGNSRFCAGTLADMLGDELLDSFHFIRDGVAAELVSARPWVFVSPTYAWQVPHVFARFISSGSFSGSRDAYFVMTCGSEIGNAARANRALCRDRGLIYRGTLQVVMPENYIALFDAPGEGEAREIVSAARPALVSGAACIEKHLNFPAPRTGPADRLKSGIVNRGFYPLVVRDRAFTVSEACVSCGQCARRCVMGNITLKDGRPAWGGHCTHCMACICLCPAAAIEYGKASKNRPRYRCPE